MERKILHDGIENVFRDESFTFTPLESLDQITIKYTDLKSIKIDDHEIIARVLNENGTISTYTIPFDDDCEKEANVLITVINRNILNNKDYNNPETPPLPENEKVERNEKNIPATILLSISSILGIAYAIYMFSICWSTSTTPIDTGNSWSDLGAELGTYIALRALFPFFVCEVLATLANFISTITTNWIIAFVAAALYLFSIALFPAAFLNVIIQMVLCVIAGVLILIKKNKHNTSAYQN